MFLFSKVYRADRKETLYADSTLINNALAIHFHGVPLCTFTLGVVFIFWCQ